MKTTIDISNVLFRQSRRLAGEKGMTFREVVETSLRLYFDLQGKKTTSFKWRHRPFKGKGMAEGLREGEWEKIRGLIYEGRGG